MRGADEDRGWGDGPGWLDDLGEAVLVADADGRVTAANQAAHRLLHLEEGAATGRALGELLGIGDLAALQDAGQRGLHRLHVRLPPGEASSEALVTLRCGGAARGGAAGWTAVVLDLTAHGLDEGVAALAERRFRLLTRNLSEVITVHAPDQRPLYGVGRGLGDHGKPPDLRERVHPDDLPRLEEAFAAWMRGEGVTVQVRARSRRGGWGTYEAAGVNLLSDPAVRGVVVTTRDVNDRVMMQDQLAYQALHDQLTELPGRALFTDRVGQALARPTRGGAYVGVLLIDIDGFRDVNDAYGHAVGDEVLAAFAGLLRGLVPAGDTVARLGSDEFAICCEELRTPAQGRTLAHRIMDALDGPLLIGSHEVRLTTSIGVAVAVADPEAGAEAVVSNADAALHRAQERGRNRLQVFDEALGTRQLRRVRLRKDLFAIGLDELDVHYQPQVRLSTGALTGFEALVRWVHPTLGDIPPEEFIPIAEETGLILPLGRFVLERACQQLALWRAQRPEAGLTMAVNLSARQLVDATLAGFLRDLLERTALTPSALCLEITENAVMASAQESERRLQELKACGVQLAIDDFGTGYSSLAYLKRFPLDQVKIDREFVWGLGINPEDAAIIASVSRLGSTLDLEVVAEGVETVSHRDEVAALGCDLGQGFLWARPRPADELREIVAGATGGWEAAVPARASERGTQNPV